MSGRQLPGESGFRDSTGKSHTVKYGDPEVRLNADKKTGLGGIAYRLKAATATGGDSVRVVVAVDDGWFTIRNADVPVTLQGVSGIRTLTADGMSGSDLIRSGYQYRCTAFKLRDTDAETPIPAPDLQTYLQNLELHPGGGKTQTVSVSAFGLNASGKKPAAKHGNATDSCHVGSGKLDDGTIGRVSATVNIFDVTFDLHDVTDDGSINRVLEGMYYATKLTANAGRGLDASTLNVTVGGKPLTLNHDFTFDEATGTLTIPAPKVTGDVRITVKAKRLVTLRNTWDPEPSVTLPVPNGKPLDETSLNEAANKHLMKDGYRLRGYLKDGAKWDLQTPITEDITLNPHWELEAPVVTIKPPTARQEHRNAQVELRAEAKLDKPSNVAFTYQWSKDGMELSGKTDARLTVTDPGTYTVTVTVTDPATNVSSQAKAMAVVAAPHQRTVTLKGRDGFESVLTRFTVANGDKLTRGQLDGKVAQGGYTITKYTKPDGSEWSFGDEVRTDLTLQPHYELKAPTVTVTAKPSKLASVGDKSTLNVRVIPPVPNATITYRWFKDGASITDVTDSTHETTHWGMYLVEVTVTDPRTGMSSKGSTSVSVGAPDKHRVTVKEKDGTHVYLTLDVYNGGTVGAGDLSNVKKDGYVLAGWVKADGSPFKPGKDKITSSLTISPLWKPGEPAKPKKVLTDTGLAVVAPAVAVALLLTAAGALVVFRRRNQ